MKCNRPLFGQEFQVKIPVAVREHYSAYSGGIRKSPFFTDKSGNVYIISWLIPFADEDGGSPFCVSVREEINSLVVEEDDEGGEV